MGIESCWNMLDSQALRDPCLLGSVSGRFRWERVSNIQMYECYESLWVIYCWSIVGNCWKLEHVAREVYLNPSDPLASMGSGGSSKTKWGFCWPRGPRGAGLSSPM